MKKVAFKCYQSLSEAFISNYRQPQLKSFDSSPLHHLGRFKMPNSTELLTPQETANLLKVHINTIYFWIKVGLLRGYKIGRVIRLKKAEVIVLDIFEN